MPKFPTRENQILTLANQMCNGFLWHADDFPSVHRIWLYFKRLLYKIAKKTQTEALSQVRLATKAKRESLKSLKKLMKNYLEKSVVDVTGSPEKLAYIGWGPKANPQPTKVPGQPTKLRIITQERRTILLNFDRPAGTVRNYIIERREQSAGSAQFGPWHIVGTALNNEINLTNQPRGVQLEYCIKAANTSGQSAASNTAAVVL